MSVLLNILRNPIIYRRLPFAVSILGIGLISYHCKKQHLVDNIGLGTLIDKFKNSQIRPEKMKPKQKMMMLNDWPFHDEILKYICEKYGDEINSFNYSVEKIYHFNEFRVRRKETPADYKVLQPNDCEITIMYKDEPIDIKFEMVKDHRGNPVKFMTQDQCSSSEEFVTKLELSASTKKLLTERDVLLTVI